MFLPDLPAVGRRSARGRALTYVTAVRIKNALDNRRDDGDNPRAMLRLAVLLALASGLLGGVAAGAGAGGSSPARTAASILAAMKARHSFRYVSTSIDDAGVRITEISDVAADHGIQQITMSQNGHEAHMTVILAPKGAYVRAGSTTALVVLLGFNPKVAPDYVNRWIFVPPHDPAYAFIAFGADVGTAVRSLQLHGPFAAAHGSPLAGTAVIAVKGRLEYDPKTFVPAVVYARATGAPLPVRIHAGRGRNGETNDFSRWNEPVHVTAPAGAVPIGTTNLEPHSTGVLA